MSRVRITLRPPSFTRNVSHCVSHPTPEAGQDGQRAKEARALSTLLSALLFTAFAASVAFGQAPHTTFGATPTQDATAAREHALVARFDCWNGADPRPGVIPSGVVYVRGDDVEHSGSDAVTGHYLDHLGSRAIVAFCTR